MGYVAIKQCSGAVRAIGKRPYRVTFTRNSRTLVKRFRSFDEARGFRSRLPFGAKASIELVTLPGGTLR